MALVIIYLVCYNYSYQDSYIIRPILYRGNIKEDVEHIRLQRELREKGNKLTSLQSQFLVQEKVNFTLLYSIYIYSMLLWRRIIIYTHGVVK